MTSACSRRASEGTSAPGCSPGNGPAARSGPGPPASTRLATAGFPALSQGRRPCAAEQTRYVYYRLGAWLDEDKALPRLLQERPRILVYAPGQVVEQRSASGERREGGLGVGCVQGVPRADGVVTLGQPGQCGVRVAQIGVAETARGGHVLDGGHEVAAPGDDLRVFLLPRRVEGPDQVRVAF